MYKILVFCILASCTQGWILSASKDGANCECKQRIFGDVSAASSVKMKMTSFFDIHKEVDGNIQFTSGGVSVHGKVVKDSISNMPGMNHFVQDMMKKYVLGENGISNTAKFNIVDNNGQNYEVTINFAITYEQFKYTISTKEVEPPKNNGTTPKPTSRR